MRGKKNADDKAIADFSEAIVLAPGFPDPWLNRGNMWRAKNSIEKAFADLDWVIRLDPTSAPAYHNRAMVWDDKGEYDKAVSEFSMAIRLDPESVISFVGRGNAEYTRRSTTSRSPITTTQSDWNRGMLTHTSTGASFGGKRTNTTRRSQTSQKPLPLRSLRVPPHIAAVATRGPRRTTTTRRLATTPRQFA